MSNHITVVGNLVRDIELRYTQGGRAVGNTAVASERRYQANGEWQSETSFFNLTLWGELAENVAASLAKGHRVVVSGRLEQRQYETKEGEKRSAFDIIVDEMGPSLRWARCEVEKITRTGANQPDQPSQAHANRPPDPVYGDEEPF